MVSLGHNEFTTSCDGHESIKVWICDRCKWLCRVEISGLAIFQNFHLPDFQNLLFSIPDYIWFRRKICSIYLPDWQFYLPKAVGQWAMSSPESASSGDLQPLTFMGMTLGLCPRSSKRKSIVIFSTVYTWYYACCRYQSGQTLLCHR